MTNEQVQYLFFIIMINIDITKIIHAAESGGREINKYFGDILEIEEKSVASDFRTKADTESEKAIQQNIVNIVRNL